MAEETQMFYSNGSISKPSLREIEVLTLNTPSDGESLDAVVNSMQLNKKPDYGDNNQSVIKLTGPFYRGGFRNIGLRELAPQLRLKQLPSHIPTMEDHVNYSYSNYSISAMDEKNNSAITADLVPASFFLAEHETAKTISSIAGYRLNSKLMSADDRPDFCFYMNEDCRKIYASQISQPIQFKHQLLTPNKTGLEIKFESKYCYQFQLVVEFYEGLYDNYVNDNDVNPVLQKDAREASISDSYDLLIDIEKSMKRYESKEKVSHKWRKLKECMHSPVKKPTGGDVISFLEQIILGDSADIFMSPLYFPESLRGVRYITCLTPSQNLKPLQIKVGKTIITKCNLNDEKLLIPLINYYRELIVPCDIAEPVLCKAFKYASNSPDDTFFVDLSHNIAEIMSLTRNYKKLSGLMFKDKRFQKHLPPHFSRVMAEVYSRYQR